MEAKLKHLEFIQNVINRLSTNSFLLKGWSVVIISALFALAAKDANHDFAFLAFLPAIAFWGLDAYFLALERGYRRHYEAVRLKDKESIDFVMRLELKKGVRNWLKAVFAITQVAFHGTVIAATVIVSIFFHGN